MVQVHYIVWAIGGGCSLLACMITAYLVYKHLRNYTKPGLQRYIVRILYMAPVSTTFLRLPVLTKYVVNCTKIYAICSTLSLIWVDAQTYFDLITSWYAFCLYVHCAVVTFNFSYEAYLLYSFFSLLVAFINEFKNEEEQEALERGDKQSKSKKQEFDSDSEEESRPLFTVVDGHKVYFGEERVVYVLKSKPPMAIGDGCHPIPTPCCKCKFGTGR